jgi:hypothetical protein
MIIVLLEATFYPGQHDTTVWESLNVADTERSQVQYFDGIWKSLANRSMQCVYKAANLWGHGDRPVSQDGKRHRT